MVKKHSLIRRSQGCSVCRIGNDNPPVLNRPSILHTSINYPIEQPHQKSHCTLLQVTAKKAMASSSSFLLGFFAIIFCLSCLARAQLDATFYDQSCPALASIVNDGMKKALRRESRLGASLLRNYFHDCFVSGCDASILLDGEDSEKFAFPNLNTARGFEVIDAIKKDIEEACPGTVSCADTLALAVREGITQLQGPSWMLLLGRKDSKVARKDMSNNELPGPGAGLAGLKEMFGEKGFTPKDLTALSGAHTIGKASCGNFRTRIYNATNINPEFAKENRAGCPFQGGDLNKADLDQVTPVVFDNQYYKNLMDGRVLLKSDQELFNNGTQDDLVRAYSTDQAAFFRDFGAAMTKLSNLGPLTGDKGEVRKDCRMTNS